MSKTRHTRKKKDKREEEKAAAEALTTIKRSALVKSKAHQQSGMNQSNRNNTPMDLMRLRTIIDGNMDKGKDIDGIMELLPDLQLVMEILTASILSPKDLTRVTLDVGVDPRAPASIAELVRSHFTSTYNLESKLSTIINEALFLYGSYSLLPLPSSSIQQFIEQNSTALESFGDIDNIPLPPLGFLEYPGGGSATEGFVVEGFDQEEILRDFGVKTESKEKVREALPSLTGKVRVHDNIFALLKPKLRDLQQYRKNKDLLSTTYGLEGIRGKRSDPNAREVDPYLKKLYDITPIAELKAPGAEEREKEELDPIVFTFRHDVILPVCQPGDPSRKVGYYIALDEQGYQLQPMNTQNYFKELNDRLEQSTKSSDYQYIKTSTNNVIYGDNMQINNYAKPMLEIYIRKVEEELAQAVAKKNGGKKETLEIQAPDSLWRLMFARQMANMETQLLYVPAEAMTYITYDYDDNGVGLSLLEKTKLYASLRAIILFANIHGGVKNAVGKRKLNITLDEDDPDKRHTLETVLNEFVALQTSTLPLGKLTPSDIVDGLQRAGIQVSVDGGEHFPGTSVDVESNERNIHLPDTDLSEELRRMQYSGLSVAPEQVDRSMEGDFATGITAGNLLFAKRTMVWQNITTTYGSEFMSKYIYCGGPLYQKLKKEYDDWEQGEDSISFEELIDSITLRLPSPDSAVVKTQMEEFRDYEDFVDAAIKYYVDQELLGDLLQEEHIKDSLDSVKQVVKAQLMRQYMRRENMLPEIDQLLAMDDSDPKPLIDQHNKKTINIISDILISVMRAEGRFEKKIRKVIEKLEEKRRAEEEEAGGGEDDEFGTDESGDTDIDVDVDEGGAEETPDEEFGGDDDGVDIDINVDTGGEEEPGAEDEEGSPEEGDEEAGDEPEEP